MVKRRKTTKRNNFRKTIKNKHLQRNKKKTRKDKQKRNYKKTRKVKKKGGLGVKNITAAALAAGAAAQGITPAQASMGALANTEALANTTGIEGVGSYNNNNALPTSKELQIYRPSVWSDNPNGGDYYNSIVRNPEGEGDPEGEGEGEGEGVEKHSNNEIDEDADEFPELDDESNNIQSWNPIINWIKQYKQNIEKQRAKAEAEHDAAVKAATQAKNDVDELILEVKKLVNEDQPKIFNDIIIANNKLNKAKKTLEDLENNKPQPRGGWMLAWTKAQRDYIRESESLDEVLFEAKVDDAKGEISEQNQIINNLRKKRRELSALIQIKKQRFNMMEQARIDAETIANIETGDFREWENAISNINNANNNNNNNLTIVATGLLSLLLINYLGRIISRKTNNQNSGDDGRLNRFSRPIEPTRRASSNSPSNSPTRKRFADARHIAEMKREETNRWKENLRQYTSNRLITSDDCESETKLKQIIRHDNSIGGYNEVRRGGPGQHYVNSSNNHDKIMRLFINPNTKLRYLFNHNSGVARLIELIPKDPYTYLYEQHRCRCMTSHCSTLYHATSQEIAQIILREQLLLPGYQGLYGGGIYFCACPVKCFLKALVDGPIANMVILEVKVLLGKVKQKNKAEPTPLRFSELPDVANDPADQSILIKVKDYLNGGYDSIYHSQKGEKENEEGGLKTGEEIIISDAFQVLKIEQKDDITHDCKQALVNYKKNRESMKFVEDPLEPDDSGMFPWSKDENSGYNLELEFRKLGWEERGGPMDLGDDLENNAFQDHWHGWFKPVSETREGTNNNSTWLNNTIKEPTLYIRNFSLAGPHAPSLDTKNGKRKTKPQDKNQDFKDLYALKGRGREQGMFSKFGNYVSDKFSREMSQREFDRIREQKMEDSIFSEEQLRDLRTLGYTDIS